MSRLPRALKNPMKGPGRSPCPQQCCTFAGHPASLGTGCFARWAGQARHLRCLSRCTGTRGAPGCGHRLQTSWCLSCLCQWDSGPSSLIRFPTAAWGGHAVAHPCMTSPSLYHDTHKSRDLPMHSPTQCSSHALHITAMPCHTQIMPSPCLQRCPCLQPCP
jgi:hypothetical protein